MKKILLVLLSVLTLTLCSCSDYKESQTYTETIDGLQITYIYNYEHTNIVSKNIYNLDTGVTIEYFYFYEEKCCGENFVSMSVVVIDKDGKVISKYESGSN